MVGISIVSGSHLPLIEAVLKGLRAEGMGATPVVAGGIIPPADARRLTRSGVKRVFTPKDYDLNAVIGEIAGLAARREGAKN